MPMLLEGACRCGSVRFEVASHTPVPYQLCYCSICRKQQGGGGFAINLGADSSTLKVVGKRDLGLYRASIEDDEHPACEVSSGERRFCRKRVHLMLKYKASWVEPDIRPGDQTFSLYPEESIAEWHKQRGLWVE